MSGVPLVLAQHCVERLHSIDMCASPIGASRPQQPAPAKRNVYLRHCVQSRPTHAAARQFDVGIDLERYVHVAPPVLAVQEVIDLERHVRVVPPVPVVQEVIGLRVVASYHRVDGGCAMSWCHPSSPHGKRSTKWSGSTER